MLLMRGLQFVPRGLDIFSLKRVDQRLLSCAIRFGSFLSQVSLACSFHRQPQKAKLHYHEAIVVDSRVVLKSTIPEDLAVRARPMTSLFL